MPGDVYSVTDGVDAAMILVAGSAHIEIPPDYAAIRIQVRDRARSREKALDSVATRATAVDALLDDFGEVVSNRVTESARVFATGAGGRLDRGFEASRTLLCEIRDPSVLGALFERLVDADAEFEGPWWRLDDTNRVHDDVRAGAAADARRRAVAYAKGVGQAVGALQWLAEPGLRRNRGAESAAPLMAPAPQAAPTLLRRGEEAEEPLLDVVVENLTVSARVEAAFHLVGE